MDYRIHADAFLVKRYLRITDAEVVFCESYGVGGKRRFRYADIDCVLLGPGNILSLQVRNEVFSLPIRPATDDTAVQALLDALRRCHSAALAGMTR